MTSSERHLKVGQPRWDYSVQKYKEGDDPFCEKGLISIIFLAHGRENITRECLLKTANAISDFQGEVEWVLIENGNSSINHQLFESFDVERKTIVTTKNYGINHGLNQGIAISRGEFILVHENDWDCIIDRDFLSHCIDIFNHQEIGLIQLRDPLDRNENFGYGKPEYNPWSCSTEHNNSCGVSINKNETRNGHIFMVSDFKNGFNNNPIIYRKSLYRQCGAYPEPIVGTDPRHGETLYQKLVADTGCLTAYIGYPVFRHVGRIQTKGN